MTKARISIAVILVLALAAYLTINLICKVNVKCENCAQHSASVEASRDDHLFVASYRALTPRVMLNHHTDTIEFSDAWAEHGWYTNSGNCFFKRKELTGDYNVVIEFNKRPSDQFNFTLEGGENSGMGLSSIVKSFTVLSDTLTFQIMEKNPVDSIGWNQPLAGGYVKFVRNGN